MPMSVLFVCWGNICRSPAAEGVLKARAVELGFEDQIYVESAGTIRHHEGESPDSRMRLAAARRGYEFEGAARKMEPGDVRRFDLILAMDNSNLSDIEEICGGRPENVHLLSDFLPVGSPVEVPDPYFGGGRGFDVVLDLLEEACPRILAELDR